MSNNLITKQLYENIYRALGGDPNVQFETADDVWNAVTDIYDEGYDPIELTTLEMTITENGVHEVDALNNDGYNKVKVNVDVPTNDISGSDFDYSLIGYNETEANEIKYILNAAQNFAISSYENNNLVSWDENAKYALFMPKLKEGTWSTPQNTSIIYAPATKFGGDFPTASGYFDSCKALKKVSGIDLTNETSTAQMFMNCSSLIELPTIDMSTIQDTTNMFRQCNRLQSVNLVNTDNITTAEYMFEFAGTNNFPSLDWRGLQNASQMFATSSLVNPTDNETWESLPFDDLNTTSALTNTSGMFSGCSGMAIPPFLNTSGVVNAANMFDGCGNMTTIPQYDFSSVVQGSNMFNYCSSLHELPELNFSSYRDQMFSFLVNNPYTEDDPLGISGFPHLTTLGGFLNFGANFAPIEGELWTPEPYLNLDQLQALTKDSMMNVINKLADIKTLFNGSGNLVFCRALTDVLTEDELAIATEKGWNVSFN